MKRAALLLVPPLVLVAVVAGVIAVEARRPREWQVELKAYLQHQRISALAELSVQAAAWAGAPHNFSPDMSQAVFGNEMRRMDLPYPPEAVWCVLLRRDGARGDVPYQVVFVAHHADPPWYDDWVVHEGVGNPLAPVFVEGLRMIGCELGLDDLEPSDIQPVVRR